MTKLAVARQSGNAVQLEPADASDLVESAQKIMQVVAYAARHLTWQTLDSFIAVMRQAEHSSDC